MIEVPLTRGKIALVDDEDVDLVSDVSWQASLRHGIWYARRNIGSRSNRTTVFMHTLLMGSTWIDHIDGNGLNNSRLNLRVVTRSQNGMNRRATHGFSGFKGVSWDKRAMLWRAKIQKEGISKSLGYFREEISAALAYDQGAREVFGSFGTFNFPHPGERSALSGLIL